MRRGIFIFLLLTLAAASGAAPVARAGEFLAEPITVPETKAVFAEVKSRTVVPARARIGGTIKTISVREGDVVSADQVIALVVDEKIALELGAAEARIEVLRSQLHNARTELERVGATGCPWQRGTKPAGPGAHTIRCGHQPDRRGGIGDGGRTPACQRRRDPGPQCRTRSDGAGHGRLGHSAGRGGRPGLPAADTSCVSPFRSVMPPK